MIKWKSIEGSDRLVSSCGFIKSPDGRIWKPAINSRGRRRFLFRGTSWHFSRALWTVFNGAIPNGLQVDHINGVKHDDRLDNYRLLTGRDNMQAFMRKGASSTSKYRGVSWYKITKRWVVQLKKDGNAYKKMYLHDEKEAARIWDTWVIAEGNHSPEALNSYQFPELSTKEATSLPKI